MGLGCGDYPVMADLGPEVSWAHLGPRRSAPGWQPRLRLGCDLFCTRLALRPSQESTFPLSVPTAALWAVVVAAVGIPGGRV